MTESDWAFLRSVLLDQFKDEDLVQQVLLELLEAQAAGTPTPDPLHWCRMRAGSRRKNLKRDREKERLALEELQGLGMHVNPSSGRDDANEIERRRRRRLGISPRRRKEAA
jgi:hypothetical protein